MAMNTHKDIFWIVRVMAVVWAVAVAAHLFVEQAHAAVFTADLSYGSRGADVQRLQTFLIEQGYFSGPVSGNFYGLTQDAVKRFQAKNSLPLTGYFGPLSRVRAEALLFVFVTKEQAKPVTITPPVVSVPPPVPTVVIQQPVVPTSMSVPNPPAPTPVVVSPSAVPDLKVPRCQLLATVDQARAGSTVRLSPILEPNVDANGDIDNGIGGLYPQISSYPFPLTATTTFTLTERISQDGWQPTTTCSVTAAPF